MAARFQGGILNPEMCAMARPPAPVIRAVAVLA